MKALEGHGKLLFVGLGTTNIRAARIAALAGAKCVCIERAGEQDFVSRARSGEQVRELDGLGVALHFGIDGEAVATLLESV